MDPIERAAREWRPVISLGGIGYARGFDPTKEYEFQRAGSDEVRVYRMADQHPMFNVAGLFWREIKAPQPKRDWTSIAAYRP